MLQRWCWILISKVWLIYFSKHNFINSPNLHAIEIILQSIFNDAIKFTQLLQFLGTLCHWHWNWKRFQIFSMTKWIAICKARRLSQSWLCILATSIAVYFQHFACHSFFFSFILVRFSEHPLHHKVQKNKMRSEIGKDRTRRRACMHPQRSQQQKPSAGRDARGAAELAGVCRTRLQPRVQQRCTYDPGQVIGGWYGLKNAFVNSARFFRKKWRKLQISAI